MFLAKDWQLRIIQLLAAPGLIIAYYLWLFHNGDVIALCEVDGVWDCGQVSGPDAPYSAIGPVPVALIGLVGYALIFFLVWLKDWWPLLDDYIGEVMVAVTGLAFAFTLGLTALEALVIGAFCQYCVYSALIVTAMFGLALHYIFRPPAEAELGG